MAPRVGGCPVEFCRTTGGMGGTGLRYSRFYGARFERPLLYCARAFGISLLLVSAASVDAGAGGDPYCFSTDPAASPSNYLFSSSRPSWSQSSSFFTSVRRKCHWMRDFWRVQNRITGAYVAGCARFHWRRSSLFLRAALCKPGIETLNSVLYWP